MNSLALTFLSFLLSPFGKLFLLFGHCLPSKLLLLLTDCRRQQQQTTNSSHVRRPPLSKDLDIEKRLEVAPVANGAEKGRKKKKEVQWKEGQKSDQPLTPVWWLHNVVFDVLVTDDVCVCDLCAHTRGSGKHVSRAPVTDRNTVGSTVLCDFWYYGDVISAESAKVRTTHTFSEVDSDEVIEWLTKLMLLLLLLYPNWRPFST